MECEGCGEKLDGIVEIAMHICPTPKIESIVHKHIETGYEFYCGRVLYKAIEDTVKEIRSGVQHKE